MIVKDISFNEPKENIFYDEALLESLEGGEAHDEVLRFWESEKFFIVLGRISKLEDDIKIKEAEKDRIEIIRRSSGGGTVLQGPGCLNYSFILSYEKNPLLRNIRKSYSFILGRICESFKKLDVEVSFEPISDMALGGRKFSGNAQRRRRKYLLHHGTILYDFDIEKIEKYLAIPKKEPRYRKGRSHKAFLTNVDISAPDIKEAITSIFKETALEGARI